MGIKDKKIIITVFVTFTITIFTSTGCGAKTYDAETLHEKGANLTKLTRKVKVAIRKQVVDDKLYIYINEKYPNEMAEFSDYSIIVKNYNGTAAVLMCDKEKTKALLEDLSCTGTLEGGYIFQKDLTCDFHLDIEEECKK